MMDLDAFNKQYKDQVRKYLANCNGSTQWQTKIIEKMPFKSLEDLLLKGEQAWWECNPSDWLEAFRHHPKIGDMKTLREKFNSGRESGEQAGIQAADEETLAKLATGNEDYLNTFGFIFIVFAQGKSASEMLSLLESRLHNTHEQELQLAAREQLKITQKRLKEIFL